MRLLLKPKDILKQWRTHLWWIFPSIVASIGILCLPTLTPLIVSSLIGLAWWIIIKWPTWWTQRPTLLRPTLYSVLGFVGLMVLLFFIDTYDVLGLGTLIKQVGLLERILDFPLIEGYQIVLRSMFENPFGGFAPIIINGQYQTSTYSMIFDTLHQGGIFALVGLLLIGTFFINQLIEFGKNKQIDSSLKVSFILFIVAFMLYQTFATQLNPFVRELERTKPRLMFDEPLWLVMFFLMGTIMIDPFVGFLKIEKKPNVATSATIKPAAKQTIKTLKKGKVLRKGKSRSMFEDHWKVLD
jgi:hypothetical protein